MFFGKKRTLAHSDGLYVLAVLYHLLIRLQPQQYPIRLESTSKYMPWHFTGIIIPPSLCFLTRILPRKSQIFVQQIFFHQTQHMLAQQLQEQCKWMSVLYFPISSLIFALVLREARFCTILFNLIGRYFLRNVQRIKENNGISNYLYMI